LNAQSGLLGISGVSSDMREIEAAIKTGNARAKLAFDIFVHRLRSGIGSMIAALNGIDVLVFTALLGFVPDTLARTLPFLANARIHAVGSENHRNRSRYFRT
jgi:acetate kinase